MSIEITNDPVRRQRLQEFAAAHQLEGPAAIPAELVADAEAFVRTGVKTWVDQTATSNGTAAAAQARNPPAVQSTPGGPGVFHAKTDVAKLSPPELQQLLTKATTCPFVKSAVNSGAIQVRNDAADPLASIKDVVAAGNSGGGDLGIVLELFATGNHTKGLDADGKLTVETPQGYWSLNLAGSQGAHAGHSGIMMGDPNQVGSGRLDRGAFERLAKLADSDGFVNYDKIGEFIADNVKRDPDGVAFDLIDAAKDIVRIVDEAIDVLRHPKDAQEKRELVRAVTERLGSNHLLGSAGEFALMFALVRNQPDKGKGNEKKVRLADLEAMMFDGQFPDGWETWPKFSLDWLKATTAIAAQTITAYAFGT